MTGWFYSIKEAFAGFAKARVSTFITIFTIFFLLSILSLFAALSLNVNRIINALNANYDIQVFLSNTITPLERQQLEAKIRDFEGVTHVQFISKEEAAIEFRQEFGEDIFDVLEENPLPASFVVSLNDDTRTRASLEQLGKELESELGIDEVVYHQPAFNALIQFSQISKIVISGLFLLVFLGSMFMVSNTIRLIILARQRIIDTMKLVGATNAFIRRPFLIEGVIQGVIGGGLVTALLYLVFQAIEWQWPGMIVIPNAFYLIVGLTGLLFGWVGSLFAVKRFL